MKGFARGLALKQRWKVIRKWLVERISLLHFCFTFIFHISFSSYSGEPHISLPKSFRSCVNIPSKLKLTPRGSSGLDPSQWRVEWFWALVQGRGETLHQASASSNTDTKTPLTVLYKRPTAVTMGTTEYFVAAVSNRFGFALGRSRVSVAKAVGEHTTLPTHPKIWRALNNNGYDQKNEPKIRLKLTKKLTLTLNLNPRFSIFWLVLGGVLRWAKISLAHFSGLTGCFLVIS